MLYGKSGGSSVRETVGPHLRNRQLESLRQHVHTNDFISNLRTFDNIYSQCPSLTKIS